MYQCRSGPHYSFISALCFGRQRFVRTRRFSRRALAVVTTETDLTAGQARTWRSAPCSSNNPRCAFAVDYRHTHYEGAEQDRK